MPVSHVTCPGCGVLLYFHDSVAAGERIQCDRCGTTFTKGKEVPNAFLDRPVRRVSRRPQPASGKTWLILLLSGGGLAVVAGVVVLILVLSGGGDGQGGVPGPSQVTVDNFNQVEAGMTRKEVRRILGAGSKVTPEELRRTFANELRFGIGLSPGDAILLIGGMYRVQTWYHWNNGPLEMFVGFGRGPSGVKRVAYSHCVRRECKRDGYSFESHMGVMAMGDLDQTARRRKEEAKLLNDPKWKTGPAVRRLLVGKWRNPALWPHFQDGYDFNADGTFARVGHFGFTSTYRFTDDRHIELTTPADKVFPPAQQPKVDTYEVLVTKDDLILVKRVNQRKVRVGTFKRVK
jgi:hypothetical protein